MNKKKVVLILVHGFNVEDGGTTTIDKLKYPLSQAGYEIDELNYPVRAPILIDILLARIRNDDLARILLDKITFHKKQGKKVIVMGHSNGYTIAHMASHLSVKYAPDMIIGINPAMKQSSVPGKGTKKVIIYHTMSDSTVRWSKFLTYITLNPSHRPWGVMGRSGYKGNDKRFTNIDLDKLYKEASGRDFPVKRFLGFKRKSKLGHSGFFNQPYFKYYTADLLKRIK